MDKGTKEKNVPFLVNRPYRHTNQYKKTYRYRHKKQLYGIRTSKNKWAKRFKEGNLRTCHMTTILKNGIIYHAQPVSIGTPKLNGGDKGQTIRLFFSLLCLAI